MSITVNKAEISGIKIQEILDDQKMNKQNYKENIKNPLTVAKIKNENIEMSMKMALQGLNQKPWLQEKKRDEKRVIRKAPLIRFDKKGNPLTNDHQD